MEIVKKKLNENFLNYPIAHRGLHGDGVCENSLEAFKRAAENGYGIELDVHLTKDNKLCVIHDSFLSRMTGKPGVAEKLTSEELKEYTLLDGQKIPMLPEVLELVNGRVPILIEAKFRRMFNEAQADELLRELESYPYKDMIALQSFHPLAVKYLKEHTEDYAVGYLSSFKLIKKKHSFLNYMLRTLKFYRLMHADFISYDITYLPNRYVARKKKHGVQVLAWTVNSKEKETRAMDVADNIIFEHIEPLDT